MYLYSVSQKRKQDDKKPLEEKIKTLKKRNAELAAIARRLEEKAKHLQQENLKVNRALVYFLISLCDAKVCFCYRASLSAFLAASVSSSVSLVRLIFCVSCHSSTHNKSLIY